MRVKVRMDVEIFENFMNSFMVKAFSPANLPAWRTTIEIEYATNEGDEWPSGALLAAEIESSDGINYILDWKSIGRGIQLVLDNPKTDEATKEMIIQGIFDDSANDLTLELIDIIIQRSLFAVELYS